MLRITAYFAICFSCTVSWLDRTVVCAQLPYQNTTPRVASRVEFSTEKEIRSKRQELSGELTTAINALEKLQDGVEQTPSGIAAQEVELLKQIDSILAQQQTGEAKRLELNDRISELKNELERLSLNGFPGQETFSFLVYDQLKHDLASSLDRMESAAAADTAALETLANAKLDNEQQKSAVRIANEQVEAGKQSENSLELEAEAKLAQLKLRLSGETLVLRRLGNELAKLNSIIAQLEVDFLKDKTSRVADQVEFSEKDLQDVLVQIERQELEIRNMANLAESRLQFAEREWSAAQRIFSDSGHTAAAKESVNTQRVKRQLCQHQFDVLNLKLGRMARIREAWQRRASVFNQVASNDELAEWSQQSKEAIANLKRERRVQLFESDDIRQEISSLDAKIQALDEADAGMRSDLSSQVGSLRDYLIANDENVASIDAAIRIQSDLLQEIEGDIEHWTFGEHVASGWSYLKGLWNTELTSIDERPITVGKVITGFILLFVGFYAARLLSRIFGNRLLTKFGLNEGAVAALKSLTFYVLVVIFTLLALRFANVPLTVFTLLGGALAIGIGFGSQTIINNFISGLILLAERPIQVGDLIRLDDLIGNVTHIGARSTRVRTGDNLDIIVPNSKFLESNVLNFTLGDDKFRSKISVGLAYGSPTREATKLLIKAAEEHGLVLDNPKPFVWFRDFGDNSLLFELHVWITIRTLGERLRIESDLRYKVDQLFREAGIVIAFPQRDMHVDFVNPIDVRVMNGQDQVLNDHGDDLPNAA